MFTTLIIFIIVLGVLVFVHEMGHFVSARIFGIGVEEFGFGFPPKIAGYKKGETLYSLNLIPLGGFVKIKGENGRFPFTEVIADYQNRIDNKSKLEDKQLKKEVLYLSRIFPEFNESKLENKSDKEQYQELISFLESQKENKQEDAFFNKKIWQRFIVLFAGVFMNILFCAFLLSFGYMIGLPGSIEDAPKNATIDSPVLSVLQIEEGAPAFDAGIEAGDTILKIDNQELTSVQQLRDYNTNKENQEIILLIDQYGIQKEVKITPKILASGNVGIGAYLTETGTITLPWYQAFITGFKQTGIIIYLIFQALFNIIKDAVTSGEVAETVSGPVGIAVLAGRAAKLGFVYILQFTALISLNLAIFNLLPIPALDGGRIIFLLIEKIRRKPVNQKIENIVHTIGFASLIGLLMLVTFRDISKFNVLGYLKDFFL
ncbi:MAG: RIP metalloprotease RseP [Patescibacteria group bacterium]